MTTFEEIDDLARALFHKANSTDVWSAVDEVVRLYFRREALRLIDTTQQRYTVSRIAHDTQRSLPLISGDG